uniref:Uncharacterized protein n=1 Tax=Hemiselmis andersenii TaxID=464988 RepID=A0A7S1DLP0_HEMAN
MTNMRSHTCEKVMTVTVENSLFPLGMASDGACSGWSLLTTLTHPILRLTHTRSVHLGTSWGRTCITHTQVLGTRESIVNGVRRYASATLVWWQQGVPRNRL